MNSFDVAIVGAGPAGLAASRAAAAQGCSVVLLDDQSNPGGQYFRQPSPAIERLRRSRFDSEPARARELIDALDSPRVDYRPNTTVWDVPEPGVLALAAGPGSCRICAQATIFATGAYDRSVPFPGWTLPGVVTAGGVQNLIKGQRVVPGRTAVVVGNGPLLLVVAAYLVWAGVTVAAVAEAAPATRQAFAAMHRLCASPGLLTRGLGYRAALLARRVKFLEGQTVLRAVGRDEVQAVKLAPITMSGEPMVQHETTVACDTLVSAFGLQSSTELPRLVGCEHAYAPDKGGWLPVRTANFETSTPGLYAVGDGARIGGGAIAQCEGTLVGLTVAEQLNGHLCARGTSELHQARKKLAKLERFRSGLDQVYRGPPTYTRLLDAATIVCRCEDVTVKDLHRARARGMRSLTQLKATTRASMGRCQGRNCLATLARFVRDREEANRKAQDWPRVRPPARPIAIQDLLSERLTPPAIPEDPHLPRGTETC